MAHLGRHRLGRRRVPPAPTLRDGTGYVVELQLEARLLGRVRLLTLDATVAVAEDVGGWVDLDTTAVDPIPVPGARRPVTTGPPPRPRLAEAATLLRDARSLSG